MRSGVLLTIAAALSIAGASNEARAAKTSAGSPSAPSGGVFLVVHSTPDAIGIRRASVSRKPIVTAKPSLTVAGWEQHPLGTEELIVTLHDRKGKLLGEYGFPTRRIAFADSLGSGGKTPTGGPRALASVELPVHVPWPDNAAFLYLWRAVVRPGAPAGSASTRALSFEIPGNGPYGPVALTVDPLGGYPLTLPLPKLRRFALPTLPLPPRHRITVPSYIDGRELIDLLKDRPLFPVGSIPQVPATPPCPSGTHPSEILGSAFAVAGGFNIVILGDGYQDSPTTHMADFHADASNVRDALLAISPFLEFKSKINVYRVDTPSVDSGVDHCPNDCATAGQWPCPSGPDPKTTALEVNGDASHTGICTEFTDNPTAIHDAACSALDPADVDLYIVLVNCDVRGGMTYPASKAIYVAKHQAVDLIAHEAGHALAPIGEEYLGGVIPCLSPPCASGCPPAIEFINVALPSQVPNSVPWISLARPTELLSGKLKTIEHRSTTNCHTTAGSTTGPAQTLGLYWGAQYLTEGPDPYAYGDTCLNCRVSVGGFCVTLCEDAYCDSRGAAFFRPMPSCTMRIAAEPYCRVCYCALRSVLVNSTGLSPTTPWCP